MLRVNMLSTLAVGGYALVLLIVLWIGVRWILRHDPGLREDRSQDRQPTYSDTGDCGSGDAVGNGQLDSGAQPPQS